MAEILEINGPILRVHLPGARNGEQVRVGDIGLVGEVIALQGSEAIVQAYESTESVRPGEPVVALGHPLSVELGPGLLGRIFDGVQRPLIDIFEASGDHIGRGLQTAALDRGKQWHFTPRDDLGKRVHGGQTLGEVPETATITQRILVPPDVDGDLLELAPAGDYTLDAVIARVRDAQGREHQLHLYQRWPVRTPRPYAERDHAVAPLLTGQRILDTFFPLLKGGKGAIPGPFGAGKTMTQHQIARWSNADIVLYVGCGERGNEMVDILESFPELTDPHTGRSLMERTLLVANTSNMPVVAREASIYVGVTMAEYFRDQGFDVVMVADSTSRWAEALREVGGRLGQMPVEEGYPAYLASRLSAFYERAGRVRTLNGERGSVTLIGAVSPPGGDFSEPVTAHTKDIVQTFWALSKELADARHYPAVDWNGSFAKDVQVAARWWHEHVAKDWFALRGSALGLLAQEQDLARIVNLVGPEALAPTQRWALEGAALIKDALLQQNATDAVDSYCSPQKQYALLAAVLRLYDKGRALIDLGVPVAHILGLAGLGRLRRAKAAYDDQQLDALNAFVRDTVEAMDAMRLEYERSAS